jgi:hypothetical protein
MHERTFTREREIFPWSFISIIRRRVSCTQVRNLGVNVHVDRRKHKFKRRTHSNGKAEFIGERNSGKMGVNCHLAMRAEKR